MDEYNYTIIEGWWRHTGCFDREYVSGIAYNEQEDYLQRTDDWWDSLTDENKLVVYNDFFIGVEDDCFFALLKQD